MTKTLLIALMMAAPLLAKAEVQRTFDGVDYYLSYDFDTADGECKLRGKDYASGFYSFSAQDTNIAYLNKDGTTKKLVQHADSPVSVIAGLTCD